MGIKLYELSDGQWQRIEALLPGKPSDPGRTATDNRLFVNGVLWVLRSGAHWSDLPERYGKYETVHKRFTRWARSGVGAHIHPARARPRQRLRDDRQFHRTSPCPSRHRPKGGALRAGSGAFPRRADLQVAYCRRHVRPPRALHSDRRRRQRCRIRHPFAHRLVRRACYRRQGIRRPCNPRSYRGHWRSASHPTANMHAAQRAFDPAKYKLRNRIERTIGKLKQLRRIATRYGLPLKTISQASIWRRSLSGVDCRFCLGRACRR